MRNSNPGVCTSAADPRMPGMVEGLGLYRQRRLDEQGRHQEIHDTFTSGRPADDNSSWEVDTLAKYHYRNSFSTSSKISCSLPE